VASRVEDPRHPAGRRRTAAPRAHLLSPPAPAPPRTHPEPDPPPARAPAHPAPLRDHGLTLLAVFTASMLVMVGLAAVTAVVGRWWILVPVMVVDLAVTTAVLASVARLLNDGNVR
jgi:hypothetical protein